MIATSLRRLITGDLRELEYRSVRLRNRLHFRLAPKGDRQRRMLFVIGHPRTGTLTLHTIFLANGVNSCHTAGRWHTSRHEAFGDRGNFQPFRALDRCYPNSWFILNTRPAFNYVSSLVRYWHSRRRWDGDLVRDRLAGRIIEGEILRRNEYYLDVIRHFQDRENLLVIDIEAPGAFDFLCGRLGLEAPGEVWANRSRNGLDAEREGMIMRAFESLGVAGENLNPFVFRSLLAPSETAEVDRFLARHRSRIYLSEDSVSDHRVVSA